MNTKKLPEGFQYLEEMYQDGYFPTFLVDKLRDTIKELVDYLENGNHTKDEVQTELDRIVMNSNE